MKTKAKTEGPKESRQALEAYFLKLLHPWVQSLPSNGSCAYWSPSDKIDIVYPVADPGDPTGKTTGGKRKRPPVPAPMRGASGETLVGITRMLSALASWTACPTNPETISFPDGSEFRPKEFLVSAISQGTDP